MLKSIYILFICIFTIVSAAAVNDDCTCQKDRPSKRPRQFRMQVYSRPNHRGAVQTMRVSNGLSSPCWNLSSRRVGSFDLNDPMVKVTFYRSPDCKGIASAVYSQHSSNQNHVMIKAKSVSVTKVKPVTYKDQCSA